LCRWRARLAPRGGRGCPAWWRVVVAAVGVRGLWHRRGGGFGGPDAVEGPAWWWPPVADALLCFFSVEDPTWWWPTVGGPCVVFFAFFLLFVVRVRARHTTKTSLFAVRLQSRRMAKPVAAVPNGLPLGNFFCRARAMTHDKGCLPCVRCYMHGKDCLPCKVLPCALCRAFFETHDKDFLCRVSFFCARQRSRGILYLAQQPKS
jgi:hypothetical protein